MRYKIENPFINHECGRLGVTKAPIQTYFYESYAQCNEDAIIESNLRAIMFRLGRQMNSIVYCEIGANHPIQTSSSYLLSRLHGASGILVEANPYLIPTLRNLRPRDRVVNCAITTMQLGFVDFFVHEKSELSSLDKNHIAKFSEFGGTQGIQEKIRIEATDINSFMEILPEGKNIDFLSIDIEGDDFEVSKSLKPEFHPSIIQCEHNDEIGKFMIMLEEKDYRLLSITEVNLIFIKRELLR